MKQPVFTCFNCGWTAQPGNVIKCDSVPDGPWYCPTCSLPLPEITLQEVKKEDATPPAGLPRREPPA